MSGIPANPLGIAFAELYGVYALLLLLATPVHLLFALILLYKAVRRRGLGPRFHLAIDLVYGLANPVLYLLVLERLAVRLPEPALTSWGYTVLVAFWGLRLFGKAVPGGRAIRTIARVVLIAAVASVACFLARDLILGQRLAETSVGVPVLLLSPLYLVPILSGVVHLSAAWDPGWEGGRLLLPWRSPVRLLAGTAAALVLASFLVSHWRPSAEETRNLVLQNRALIEVAAGRYGIEPGTLAALVYVTHREHSNPFRLELEDIAMTAWLGDMQSHDGLSRGLDVSIGLAQVKPLTALAAMVIRFRCAGVQVGPIKHLRDLPPAYLANPISPEVCVVARDAHGDIVDPPLPNGSGKDSVVAALLDPAKNLEFAAFILSAYATQWERAPGAAAIRNRPDILSTLYQIGFERSHPKANPIANEFGSQVLAAANEAWLRELFSQAGSGPHRPERASRGP